MMEKKIHNYLHLYLGCEMECVDESHNIHYLGRRVLLTTGRLGLEEYYTIYKPILRPLSDMTEDEAIEVFKMCSLIDLSDCKFEFGENYETWINANRNGVVIDAIKFVGDNIEMMNNGGSFNSINPVAPVTAYYLSKHFDLFGLIDSGLAIDATTLTKN